MKKNIISRFQRFISNLSSHNSLFKHVYILIVLFALFFSFPANAGENYPKLANYYLKSPISSSEISQLAKWDVVILGMQIQDTNPEIFSLLRTLNPDIKIIAYLSAMEFPNGHYNLIESSNDPWHQMKNSISASWYLKDGSGNIHSIWPGNYSFNLTNYCPTINGKKFNSWLPEFVNETLMQSGNWDGVFYDNVLDGITQTNYGKVDVDNNGAVDDATFANTAWREGNLELLKNTRALLGADKIILNNSSSYGSNYINGRLYESWPDSWQGAWVGQMNDYKNLEQKISSSPQIIILNPNTNNTGNNSNYQKVRYGIASTLMGNGYFAFDYGTQDHSQLWWYDEYTINLGEPISKAYNLLNNNSTKFEAGVWQRDFTNGSVLLNSTNKSQTINLENGTYEKIKGTQDISVNSGELIKKITLAPEDGIILYRKLALQKEVSPITIQEPEQQIVRQEYEDVILTDVVFTNGDFVRVFDKRGNQTRVGFYAYDKRFPGGSQIIITDINADGIDETIVAFDDKIQIFNNSGLLLKEFYPFGYTFNKGINLSVGNVTGDDKQEIVVAIKNNSQPFVRIFNVDGEIINDGFFAYAENFYGGVNITLGDLNGNGYKEIITGTGFSGGPHVRIFDATGHLFDPGFFPYDENFRGGVNVTTGDLNSDGKDEIITGAGRTGGPHVRIYDNIGHLVDPGFFAYKESDRLGVRVGTTDIDHDGQVEILTFR